MKQILTLITQQMCSALCNHGLFKYSMFSARGGVIGNFTIFFGGVTPRRFKCTWFRKGILGFSLECTTLLQSDFFKQGYIPLNVTIPGQGTIDPNTHLCRTFLLGIYDHIYIHNTLKFQKN